MTVDELIEKLQLLNVGSVEVTNAYYDDLKDVRPIEEVTYIHDSEGERVVLSAKEEDYSDVYTDDDDDKDGLWDDCPPVGFFKVVSRRSER